jgi:CHAT domain
MTKTFQEAFPSVFAVRPFMTLAPNLAWSTPLTWADENAVVDFATVVLEQQSLASQRDFGWLDELSDALITDINSMLHEAEINDEPNDGLVWRSLLFLRFLVSVVPMEKALGLGQRGQAHDWAFRGISTDHDRTRRYNSGYAYLPWRQANDPLIGEVATRWLPRWCTTFFLLARDVSIRIEIVQTFAVCWDILLEILELDGPRIRQLKIEIYFGLASLASWAISEDYERRDEWVIELERAWDAADIPDEAASIVGTIFITRANPITKRTIRDWACEILERFGGTLREHERLQYVVASIDTRERWLVERQSVLAEIDGLNQRASGAEQIGSSALLARDARIDVIKPLIRMLVLDSDLAGAMDLLRAWYRIPGWPPCDDNVLFIHPALEDGVAMLWPGRSLISFDTAKEGHGLVVVALDKALRIARDPDVDIVEEHREGIPDYALGPGVESAMERYYRPAKLAEMFKRIANPRSLVVFPSVSDPLQALLARELSITLPLEVSLAEARPMREIKMISIWAGYTQFTHFEVELIQVIASRHGVVASVFSGSEDGDADDFRAFYEQPEPDVLWVCGHGEFVAHQLRETGIVVATPRAQRLNDQYANVILPMETVARFLVPGDARRLLVLNTCNGATTQGMAGLARIGLAQSLVQPTQMVIGHLWPASAALGLAFGGLFASNLACQDITAAFATTLLELRDPTRIVGLVEERSGVPFNGGFRVASACDELSSIMAWGCPVLLT